MSDFYGDELGLGEDTPIAGRDTGSPGHVLRFDILAAAFSLSEGEVAHGVTKWIMQNFGPQLDKAVRGTPFSSALLCAIACREAGIYWLPLTANRSAAEVLRLCVYDASGDVAGALRSAPPRNTADFRARFGEQFTNELITAANHARIARGLEPSNIVYKGYGIFQYDLQYVFSDEVFFRKELWHEFDECVARAVRELVSKFKAYGDIRETVRAYNGSGAKAERYANDVMRLLPYCERAAGYDPAAPELDEISGTSDIATARFLANLGAGGHSADDAFEPRMDTEGVRLDPEMPIDFPSAAAFLEACRSASPRVLYGLGAKVPFPNAVPGRDFQRIDCSGFVREAICRSTVPRSRAFPDGSVNQHDWVLARGYAKDTVASGLANDGAVRIAFLRPQDTRSGIGHVVLIHNGATLESHGGVGPDTRPWTGEDWQAKAYVYVLKHPGRGDVRSSGGAPASVKRTTARGRVSRAAR